MKVYSINNSNYLSENSTQKSVYRSQDTVHRDPQKSAQGYSAGVCDNKRGYNVNFSGSLPKEGVAAANVLKDTFGTRILKSKTFGSILKLAEEAPVACSALFSLALAGVLRPATIMSLPGKKDKEDKIYASGHSIASGVIGFVFSYLFTKPIGDSMKKVSKNPKGFLKKAHEYLGNLDAKGLTKSQIYKNVDAFVKMAPNLLICIPQAVLTIALIPPILKYVFGVQKKPKNSPQTASVQPQIQNIIYNQKPMPIAFQDFKGGVK